VSNVITDWVKAQSSCSFNDTAKGNSTVNCRTARR